MLPVRLWIAAVLICGCVGIGVLAPPAVGAENPVIADCTAHGALTVHYPLAQLQSALRGIPTIVKEYTNCSDVIQRALNDSLASSRHDSGSAAGGGSGGSFLPVPLIIALSLLIIVAAGFGVQALRGRGGSDSRPT